MSTAGAAEMGWDGIDWGAADCHYGDHAYHGTGACVRCGVRLRCYCGAFVREDSIEAHFETCRIVLKYASLEAGVVTSPERPSGAEVTENV